MQTFIIWIPSVICLMIHIPQVYGATAFNSDNDGGSTESDEISEATPALPPTRRSRFKAGARRVLQTIIWPIRKLREVRRRRRAAIRLNTFSRRMYYSDYTRSHGRGGKSLQDLPLARTKLRHFSRAGAEIDLEEEQCELLNKIVTVTLGNGQKMISKGCFLKGNMADHQLVYTVDTIEDSGNTTKTLHVDCDGHIYTMDEDGQGFIEVRSHKSKLDFEDPFKEMNGDIFAQLPNCHEILAVLQRTVLQGSPEDSAGRKVGDDILEKMCKVYQGEAVSSFTSPSARLEDGDFDGDYNYDIHEEPDMWVA